MAACMLCIAVGPLLVSALRDETTSKQFDSSAGSTVEHDKLPEYNFVKIVTAPVPMECREIESWNYAEIKELREIAGGGAACGVVGYGEDALEKHLERIWNLIKNAAKTAKEDSSDVLYIFVASEWVLGRRFLSDPDGTEKPLNAADLQFTIEYLTRQMRAEGDTYKDWLVLPGSFFWGVEATRLEGETTPMYLVFNSLPIFFGGKLIWVHNKQNRADALWKNELWGYTNASNREVTNSTIMRLYGHRPQEDYIELGGRTIGIDICADHDRGLAKKRAKNLPVSSKNNRKRYDLQILVAAGINVRGGAATVRMGGLAIGVDGDRRKTRVLLRKKAPAHLKHYEQIFWTYLDQYNDHATLSQTLNSWEDGCNRNIPNSGAKICELCKSLTAEMPKDYDDLPPEAMRRQIRIQKFCRLEVSNFASLTIFKKIKIKAPKQKTNVVGAVFNDSLVEPWGPWGTWGME